MEDFDASVSSLMRRAQRGQEWVVRPEPIKRDVSLLASVLDSKVLSTGSQTDNLIKGTFVKHAVLLLPG